MNDTVERKTITVSPETFEMLNNRRTGTWDEFLKSFIQNHSSPHEPLTEENIDDIANMTARKTAEELEARLR